jgi:hypothetical protein
VSFVRFRAPLQRVESITIFSHAVSSQINLGLYHHPLPLHDNAIDEFWFNGYILITVPAYRSFCMVPYITSVPVRALMLQCNNFHFSYYIQKVHFVLGISLKAIMQQKYKIYELKHSATISYLRTNSQLLHHIHAILRTHYIMIWTSAVFSSFNSVRYWFQFAKCHF